MDTLRRHSFQWFAAQLPVKLGGLGVRLQEPLAPFAYLGTVEICLPSFTGRKGICTALSHLVGESETSETKWECLIKSGSRLGKEFEQAWHSVKTEAEQCSSYVGDELPDIFVTEAAGFGLGAESGSRQKLVQNRELLLAKTLTKALEDFSDPSSMAVKAWKNRDKMSTAFLLDLPGAHNQWTSAAFSEAMCLLLALTSIQCKELLGLPVGDRQVDLFGSEVLCANLPGGSWMRRHDCIKGCISSLCVYAGANFVCEPFSIFSAHIPQ